MGLAAGGRWHITEVRWMQRSRGEARTGRFASVGSPWRRRHTASARIAWRSR